MFVGQALTNLVGLLNMYYIVVVIDKAPDPHIYTCDIYQPPVYHMTYERSLFIAHQSSLLRKPNTFPNVCTCLCALKGLTLIDKLQKTLASQQ